MGNIQLHQVVGLFASTLLRIFSSVRLHTQGKNEVSGMNAGSCFAGKRPTSFSGIWMEGSLSQISGICKTSIHEASIVRKRYASRYNPDAFFQDIQKSRIQNNSRSAWKEGAESS
jgi:hypothetical protein